ncbi:triose-phosphate isomerase [Spiroplasma ixodetis]|uniref:triose-phosphate isomerase n=1 Tax=Spiroplasma ixodetis TaxID=2141 RepID=UPI0025759E87|nr:triose-phosphate isomerase [Spiroplasma ixodetis]WJG70082.1 triosephosphate isomerase [Spiroplasma ixodetis Y32]
MERKKIIIGNWKMYKNIEETQFFLNEFNKLIKTKNIKYDYGIAASFTNLPLLKMNKTSALIIAAQNCHYETEGAYTGEISIKMLKDMMVSHVIIGHSERRMYFNEVDETINKKLHSLFNANIIPILCCGETLNQYENKETNEVIKNQIKLALKNIKAENIAKLVIAYEPIWAIGTGKTATAQQAQTVCKMIREFISELYNKNVSEQVRIQYGGSVKPDNIKLILSEPDIDGALVGDASLVPQSFFDLLI